MNNQWYIPLMDNNIEKDDILALREFLNPDKIPQITNGPKVRAFEEAWSKWLGVKHTVMLNSGSSANIISLAAIKELYDDGRDEVICAPLCWCSDFYAILYAGYKPRTCDISFTNLSFDIEKLKKTITPKTRAIIAVSILGLNCYTQELLDLVKEHNLILIGDHCESHGTIFNGQKLGSLKEEFMSNFSGYFGHHVAIGEAGWVSTNNTELYNYLRAFRAHGLAREIECPNIKQKIINENSSLNKDFIFIAKSFNFRPMEIQGVGGITQLAKLDRRNEERRKRFEYFLNKLDSIKYYTKFDIRGQCAYSFIIILNKFNRSNWSEVEKVLQENKIEYRRGLSGGGSQLKNPYALKYFKENNITINDANFPVMEHIHYCSAYVGLYPSLEYEKIDRLLEILNNINFE